MPKKLKEYLPGNAPTLDAFVQISIIDQKIIDATGIFIDGYIQAQQVPEPFTIIGTLIGGTAALRMRNKLK